MSKTRRSTEFKNSSRLIDMDEAREKRREKRDTKRANAAKRSRHSNAASISEDGQPVAGAKGQIRSKTALRRKRNRRRLLLGIVFVVIAVIIGVSVIHVVSLKIEQLETKNEQEELKAQKEALEEELENVGSTETVEEEARGQLRLVLPGETLYIFDDSVIDNSSTAAEDEE